MYRTPEPKTSSKSGQAKAMGTEVCNLPCTPPRYHYPLLLSYHLVLYYFLPMNSAHCSSTPILWLEGYPAPHILQYYLPLNTAKTPVLGS